MEGGLLQHDDDSLDATVAARKSHGCRDLPEQKVVNGSRGVRFRYGAVLLLAGVGCDAGPSGPDEAAATSSGSTAADWPDAGSSGTTVTTDSTSTTGSMPTTDSTSTLGGTSVASGDTTSNGGPSSGGATGSGSEETGNEPAGTGDLVFARNGSIVLLDLSTGEETLLSAGYEAYEFVWDSAADGVYFQERVPGGGDTLYRSDLFGNTTELFSSERTAHGLTVSANGEQLVWQADHPEGLLPTAFVVVDSDGSNPTELPLSFVSFDPWSYAFFPDFSRLARPYGSIIQDTLLPRVSMETLVDVPCSSGVCAAGELAYSPSGSQLAFTVAAGTASFPINNLYVVDMDGSNLINLTADVDVRAWRPRWSFDGQRVAFTSPEGESTDIYVVQTDGTGLQNISNTEGREHEPAWSSSGLQLAWLRGDSAEQDVVVYDFETQEASVVATDAYIGLIPPGYSRSTPAVAWRP